MPNQWRVTHYKDIVPQVPPQKPLDYHHVATEMYENENGSVKTCNGSGEDPTCSDQWHTW